jgi:hypothetical protein
MNIYEPYMVITDDDSCLQIALGAVGERFNFIATRALPIGLIMLTWLVLQQIGAYIPMGWIYVIITGVVLVALYGFTKKNMVEITITSTGVEMVQQSISGSKHINIPVSGIERISYSTSKSKTPLTVFTLYTNTQKKYPLLRIAGIPQHITGVSNQLTKLLSVIPQQA